MKTPFRITEKTAATAVGSTRTCDSRESLVQVGKVAGATLARRGGRTKKVVNVPKSGMELNANA